MRQAQGNAAVWISEATFRAWLQKYTSFMSSGMRRLRPLQEENGKLTKMAADLSLDGKCRAERLNAHWLMRLDDVPRKCAAWRGDYNEVRSHSPIENKAPIEPANRFAAHGPLIERRPENTYKAIGR